jgi:hypothetical protein
MKIDNLLHVCEEAEKVAMELFVEAFAASKDRSQDSDYAFIKRRLEYLSDLVGVLRKKAQGADNVTATLFG